MKQLISHMQKDISSGVKDLIFGLKSSSLSILYVCMASLCICEDSHEPSCDMYQNLMCWPICINVVKYSKTCIKRLLSK